MFQAVSSTGAASACRPQPVDIEEKAISILNREPRLARREVHCHAEEDRLILRGWVRSFFEKQVAQEVLRRLEGVREICNELEVHPEPEDAAASRFWWEPEDLSTEVEVP